MKRVFGLILATVLLFAVFGIAEAGSGKSASVIKLPDTSVGFLLNPCEGTLTEVMWSDIKLIVRDADNPHGNSQFIETLVAKLSDSGGYSGHITWPWKANVGKTVTVTDNLIVTTHKPGTGKTVQVQSRVHVTIVDGTPVVDFEMGNFTCVGKLAD